MSLFSRKTMLRSDISSNNEYVNYSGYFFIYFVIVLFLMFYIYYFCTKFNNVVITINKDDIVVTSGGNSQNIVSDSDGNVYKISNNVMVFFFTASELLGKLEENKKYKINGYGLRIPFLGLYPQITSFVEV